MAVKSIPEFEELLKKHFPIYQPPRGSRGMRMWAISGGLVFDSVDVDAMLVALKAKLPFDVTLNCSDGQAARVSMRNGNYYDRFDLCFMSSKWQGPREGEAIPEIQATFFRDPDMGVISCTSVEDIVSSGNFESVNTLRGQVDALNAKLDRQIVTLETLAHRAYGKGRQLNREDKAFRAEQWFGKAYGLMNAARFLRTDNYSEGHANERFGERVKSEDEAERVVDAQGWSRAKAIDSLLEQIRDAYDLRLQGSPLKAGVSAFDVTCCNTMDWNKPGVDMKKPHHPECVNYVP